MDIKKLRVVTWSIAAFLSLNAGAVSAAPVLTDWTNYSNTLATGSLGGNSVNFSSSSNVIADYFSSDATFNFFSESDSFSPALTESEMIAFMSVQSNTGYQFQIDFGSVIENPIIYISDLDSVLTFDPSVSISLLSGNDLFGVAGNVISELDPYGDGDPINSTAKGVIQLDGSYSSVSFNSSYGDEGNDLLFMQIAANEQPAAISAPSGLLLFSLGLLGIISRSRKG